MYKKYVYNITIDQQDGSILENFNINGAKKMKNRHTRYEAGQMSSWEQEVYRWQYKARGNHFDMQLVILYSKADTSNRKLIAKGFPELAAAFSDWFYSAGVFDEDLKATQAILGGEA